MIAAVAGVFVWRSFFGGTTTGVPSVVGQAQAAATAQLRTDGFTVTAHDDYSDQYGVGLVTRQQPVSGAKLAKGGTVDIWVSRGPASTTLTDLTRFTPAAVATYLAKYGLVGKEHAGSSTAVPKGEVYKQSPQPGVTVKRGDTVDLLGEPRPAAGERARPLGARPEPGDRRHLQRGLLVGTIDQTTSTSVPVGQVVSQTPSANVLVARGTHSVVRDQQRHAVAHAEPPRAAPPGTPSPVPSVVTMPQTQAEQLLTNDGFVVAVKKGTSSLGSGYVYKQSPRQRHRRRPAARSPSGSRSATAVARRCRRPRGPPQALAMKIT